MIVGLLLIAAALLLVGYNLVVDYTAGTENSETLSEMNNLFSAENKDSEDSQPEYLLNPYMEMPIITIDEIDYVGKITIPELQLELPVASECNYPNLRIAPCRYSGSVYLDNMVIAAHNYSSHFGHIKNLSVGDNLIFTDADGHAFQYKIVDMEILNPTDVEDMTTGEWDLTLFTCTIGGRTRVTVRCDRCDKETRYITEDNRIPAD